MTLYLEGPMGSGKTQRLIDETRQLLEHAPSASILVLCSNHSRQKRFAEKLLAQLSQPLEQLSIYTYAGYVRTTLFNFWPLVEAEIHTILKKGSAVVMPQLSGMEDTEFLLKAIVRSLRQKHPMAFSDFPGTEAGLLKQLVRRIRLRSENRLSRDEMRQRSELLGEICIPEVAEVEKRFDGISYTLRVLDSNKQLDVFHRLVENNEILQQWLKTHIRHLVVDDVDETLPAQQRFIEFLAPTLETLIMAADIDGGSRRGYLNAYPYDWQALKTLKAGETIVLERSDPMYQNAQRLLHNWKQTEDFEPLAQGLTLRATPLTRVEMLDQVVEDIFQLLHQGYHPGDITIVLPQADPLTLFPLQSRLKSRGIPTQLLSGTRRTLDQPLYKPLLYLLQLANTRTWKYYLSPIELKALLTQILQFHTWPQEAINTLITACQQQLAQPTGPLIPDWEGLSLAIEPVDIQRYQQLRAWLEKIQGLPFEKQLLSAFQEIIAPLAATETNHFSDLSRWLESYTRQKAMYDNLGQSGMLDVSEVSCFEHLWLSQVKTGVVADTPELPEAIDPDAIVMGTPQKIIDEEISRKIQCWLDIGSREWSRSDNAPLYHAWVHSAVWDGSSLAFTEDFNEAVIRARAAHITRTLMLLAREEVRAYGSELDTEGFSSQGLLKSRLLCEAVNQPIGKIQERAVLRSDQAPILEYQQGTMAITAVPGAGKTFVNVELILELIERGTPPQGILVLTYMDSAAKTLLGRLQKKLSVQGIHQLPVVSTIHSLALRILSENDHALTLGFLPDDIEILDDGGQEEILARVAQETCPAGMENSTKWLRAIGRGIAHAKAQGLRATDLQIAAKAVSQSFRLQEFLPAYTLYEHMLRENGQLDFTDLILKAVELLEKAPDIRQKYQQQFAVILEDEAQDSSRLLQRLIGLLGGHHPNLIRTGDANQSITTTFSSADPSVFRDFIRQADCTIQMDQSGRCAPEIIQLANNWILACQQDPILQEAFRPVMMRPVSGQNPELLYPPTAHLFELDREEDAWLVQTIQQLYQEHPEKSIAILTRRNEDVSLFSSLLQQAGVPAISFSDRIDMHPVFSVLLAYLQLLENPMDCGIQLRLWEALLAANLVEPSDTRQAFLATHALIAQSPATLHDEFLLQLYYDLLDFSRETTGHTLCPLLIRMTDRLFHTVGERSNGYLCALWAQDILKQNRHLDHLSPLEIVTSQFSAYQKSKRRKKTFQESMGPDTHGFVQILNLHKSKGQEFDIVFMPHLSASLFPHRLEAVRFEEGDKLVQEVDRVLAHGNLSEDYADQCKRTKIEEEARLLYVGLTRARRALFLSSHTQAFTRYGKLRPADPAWAFKVLQELLQRGAPVLTRDTAALPIF